MDASGAADESATLRTAKSCGPDAPTLASSVAEVSARRRWQTSPVTGESAKETAKTIACGNAGCPGATVVTNACATTLCARGCGCNGHPAFPTPLLGGSFMHNSGASRRGNMKLYLTVIVRLDRTIQYSRALVMESKSCGVLDTPLSRSMTAYYGAAQCVGVASRRWSSGLSARRECGSP